MGSIREEIDDFRVEERLDLEFSDSGEHLYVHIEKKDLNTQDVQRALADHYGVPRLDVSYSGLKDKRAITSQWFSVRLPKTEAPLNSDKIATLTQRRHSRKLRIGSHQANRFSIRVRDVVGGDCELATQILGGHCPNYFGHQRFGRDFNNIRTAREWVEQGRPRISRKARAWHLSTLRSLVFNEVLGRRVLDGNWDTPISGDRAIGLFPTGPLWGRGTLPTSGVPREIEDSVRKDHAEVCDALEWVGLRQQRRSLVAQAGDVEVEESGRTMSLGFTLSPGTYATVVLAECFELREQMA